MPAPGPGEPHLSYGISAEAGQPTQEPSSDMKIKHAARSLQGPRQPCQPGMKKGSVQPTACEPQGDSLLSKNQLYKAQG